VSTRQTPLTRRSSQRAVFFSLDESRLSRSFFSDARGGQLTTKGRVRDDVPEPAKGPLEQCFGENGLPDVRRITEHFVREGRLKTADALRLIAMAQSVISEEPNMLELAPPMTIAGDLHGQCVACCSVFSLTRVQLLIYLLSSFCHLGFTTCCSCSKWRATR
jgi:hypothetical protein